MMMYIIIGIACLVGIIVVVLLLQIGRAHV